MFDDIYRMSDRSKLAQLEEFLALETIVGCPFPNGYREFVTRFGEGNLTGWVRVHMPGRVREEHRQFQERVGEFFDWVVDESITTERQVAESIRFGDTMNGDELIFHPSESNRILVLPRHQERIHVAGSGLERAIDWLFASGELIAPISLKAFEPDCEYRRIDFGWNASCAGPREVRQSLRDLGLHDAHFVDNDGEDIRLELFVKQFGGKVVLQSELDYKPVGEYIVSWNDPTTGEHFVDGIPMAQIPRRAKVWMRHDTNASGPKLEAIIQCLESLGFQKQGHSGAASV